MILTTMTILVLVVSILVLDIILVRNRVANIS